MKLCSFLITKMNTGILEGGVFCFVFCDIKHVYWYTILEAGNIGPEGRDNTETENRILPDPRDNNNRFITRLSYKYFIY